MNNNEFGILDTNDPKDLKKMEELLKKKYEESKKSKTENSDKKESA